MIIQLVICCIISSISFTYIYIGVILSLIYYIYIDEKKLVFVFLLICLCYQFNYNNNFENEITNEPNTILVEKDLKQQNYNTTFIGSNSGELFKVTLKKDSTISYGDLINIDELTIETIDTLYHNPSSFNFTKYYKEKKIKYEIKSQYHDIIKHNNNFKYKIANWREQKIQKNTNDYPKIGEYINALVFGHNKIEKNQKQLFNNIGLAHCFCISGAHIYVLLFIINFLFAFFNIRESYTKYFSLLFLVFNLIITGGSIPIIRATFVNFIFILSNKQISKVKLSYICLILFYLFNPFIYLNVGFILTFSISILFYHLEKISLSMFKLQNTFTYHFIILISTFPITTNINYSFNPLILLSTIILTPIISILLLPLSYILCFCGNNQSLVYIYNILLVFLCNIGDKFNSFTYIIGHVNKIYIFLYFSLLGCYYFFRKKIFIYILFVFFVIALLNVNIMGCVDIIDVGQGDCILIQLPLMKGTIMIDTGTEKSSDEVVTYLKYLGINKIDVIFITHWHDDHFGGLKKITDNFSVDTIYNYPSDAMPKEFMNINALQQNDQIIINGYQFDVLSPSSKDKNTNNESLVIKVSLGGEVWLFTGDIESEIEAMLVEKFDLSPITYLKVPHHGSKTSSTINFITEISPKVAVISVGAKNKFKHPDIQTLSRYEQLKIPILKTSENGLIHYNFIFNLFW